MSQLQPTLGILVLDTGFPRIPGDVGNPDTWPFPVLMNTVQGATPTRVTGPQIDELLDLFVVGAHELVDQGVQGITTTCGFLAALQRPLAERCPVPLAATSLLQIPSIEALLPAGKRVGVVTFSAKLLTPDHLAGAGAPRDTPREGLSEDSEFYRMIIEGHKTLDFVAAERDTVAAAQRLADNNPDVGAIVVECANMPPYSARIREAVGLPVFDPFSFVSWFYSSLQPRTYTQG